MNCFTSKESTYLSGTPERHQDRKGVRRLETRLESLDTLETDPSLWKSACDLGFGLRRKGLTVPHTDIVIAACALRSHSIVLRADTHFDSMAKKTDLQVESFVPTLNRSSLSGFVKTPLWKYGIFFKDLDPDSQ